MGPVNSNHFLPQAQDAFRHYHGLALTRAAECAAVGARLAGSRFADVARACEVEALALEAVAQHFLQDAWSMGHMWQRWGSTELADFPGPTAEDRRDRAVLVALVSGFFHGARSVLQALPGWTTLDVNDALCAPWDDVQFRTADGVLGQGIGDNYVALLSPNTSNSTWDVQGKAFFDCATSAVLEVYRAAGAQHGPAQPIDGLTAVDPAGAACFGQRATNAAMARAAAVNLKVAGQQVTIPLDATFVSWMVPKVARASGKVPVAPKLRNEFRFSLQRVVTMARLRAKEAPLETDLADGALADLLGARPNGRSSGVASFLDPPLPWQPTGERTRPLTRLFHRAHATEWCEALDAGDLAALRTHARDTTLDAEGKAAACAVCTELVVRHLRVGTPGAWDTSQEPLCHLLTSAPAYVYHQAAGLTAPAEVAARWCCP
jgi:hypothetical protein